MVDFATTASNVDENSSKFMMMKTYTKSKIPRFNKDSTILKCTIIVDFATTASNPDENPNNMIMKF